MLKCTSVCSVQTRPTVRLPQFVQYKLVPLCAYLSLFSTNSSHCALVVVVESCAAMLSS